MVDVRNEEVIEDDNITFFHGCGQWSQHKEHRAVEIGIEMNDESPVQARAFDEISQGVLKQSDLEIDTVVVDTG